MLYTYLSFNLTFISKQLSLGVSQVAQSVVKNLSAVKETQVPSLGWEIPWRKKYQPTAVLLLGKSHGQGSLAGYSALGSQESDTTEHQCTHTSV